MTRELLAIQDLEKTTPEFRRKLVEVADRRGLNPSFLAAVIHFESGFDPTAENPYSSCYGLIQFCMPESVGTTFEDLRQMDELEQLDYVEKHYAMVDPNKTVRTLEDHYLAVLSPACIGYPSTAILPCKGSKRWTEPPGGCLQPLKGPYCQNKGLDFDHDGQISVYEATTPVRQRVNLAQGKPPLLVEDAPTGEPPPGPQPPIELPALASSSSSVGYLALGGVIGYLSYQLITRAQARVGRVAPGSKRRRRARPRG